MLRCCPSTPFSSVESRSMVEAGPEVVHQDLSSLRKICGVDGARGLQV